MDIFDEEPVLLDSVFTVTCPDCSYRVAVAQAPISGDSRWLVTAEGGRQRRHRSQWLTALDCWLVRWYHRRRFCCGHEHTIDIELAIDLDLRDEFGLPYSF